MSPTTGYASAPNTNPISAGTVTINGSGFAQGDTVTLFITTSAGYQVDHNMVTVSLVSPTQIIAVLPSLNSGDYSVQVSNCGTESNVVSYTVTQQNPPPALFSIVTSVTPTYQGSDTYSTLRLFTSNWSYELKPANDAASATAWCKLVPGKGYTSGTYSSNPYSNVDDYKYDFNGSQWIQTIQGEYASYYQCSGGQTTQTSI